ncbi:sulfide/dihydroorotate dehydrogenase-like FAD/NAD-binding protein [Enterococcus sp. CSURQ0835]|uniref:sulfide/dihydroorotate dehydrogenase-like FAD/NAD-binding protein n=1 Tax=Enterococcus sp. CSURQ0835 TaxID=2681394 RepID=UPI001356E139|nr:sulfide/dihydroorotate dehydrogenase-like FAD/NAD-binding protein [Enterococcus sp. CSURQ0835]
MFTISQCRKLSENEFEFWVEAPLVAKKAKPGQFVILRINEVGERIPLTIVDCNEQFGTIHLIFQVIGKSTAELAQLKNGDQLHDLLGPLGKPTAIKNYGHVLLVGGGVGIAALYPIIKGLKQAGNRVVTILGAKTKELVILQEECRKYSDQLIIMTDDGSLGRKGLVTDAMKAVFEFEKINHTWAVGPSMMMKFCTLTAENYHVPIFVSLNPIMIDGTGMCGGCRVTIADSVKFACIDGPEFLGSEVNWDEFIMRLGQYRKEEAVAFETYQKQVKEFG